MSQNLCYITKHSCMLYSTSQPSRCSVASQAAASALGPMGGPGPALGPMGGPGSPSLPVAVLAPRLLAAAVTTGSLCPGRAPGPLLVASQ